MKDGLYFLGGLFPRPLPEGLPVVLGPLGGRGVGVDGAGERLLVLVMILIQ